MSKKNRVPIEGGGALSHNPFEALSSSGLPPGPEQLPDPTPKTARERLGKPKNRGRLDIIRNTAHRGGKTVTVIAGFKGIQASEIADLAKKIQKSCGTGGTVKDGTIEIQGDRRESIAAILKEAGFKPVFAGG